MTSELKEKLINKVKATFVHLLFSLLIFIVILYFILVEWYPEPFFTAQGGMQGIRLMALVHLVLGPLLTFIVFDHLKKKKDIVFDLSLIAIVQIVALIWGGFLVYSQRPIALVFWEDAFYTVVNDDYAIQGLENPDFSQFSAHVPPLIYVRSPTTQAELEEFRRLSRMNIPIYAHVSSYESIKDNLDHIFSSNQDIQEIVAVNSNMKSALSDVIEDDIDAYKYIALKAKYQNMILVFDNSGAIKGELKAPYLNFE